MEYKPHHLTQNRRLVPYGNFRRDQRQKIFQFPKGGPQGNGKFDPPLGGALLASRGEFYSETLLGRWKICSQNLSRIREADLE